MKLAAKYWATNEQCWCEIVKPIRRMFLVKDIMVLCRRLSDGYEWYVPSRGLKEENH